MKIIKRSGEEQVFDLNKIINAISKAYKTVNEDIISIVFEEGKLNTVTSTKYILESRCYQAAGGYLDKIYYYLRDGGGFYLKAFGVNKSLKLKNPIEIEINAKWNIIAEYDENGFLVSETFQTLNAYKAPDTESIYGKCTYTYH